MKRKYYHNVVKYFECSLKRCLHAYNSPDVAMQEIVQSYHFNCTSCLMTSLVFPSGFGEEDQSAHKGPAATADPSGN